MAAAGTATPALSLEDVDSLKVAQIKRALGERGLSTDGERGELAARLKAALSHSEHGDSGTAATKRGRAEVADDSKHAAPDKADDADSDDDYGPAPAAPTKKRTLMHEQVFVDLLPNAALYEKSYNHRDVLSHVIVTPVTDFVVTVSVDGNLKFWKKMPEDIEFVKHYRAHVDRVLGVASSSDGRRLCTAGDDKVLKFYDVANFDMTLMLPIKFVPGCCTWIYPRGAARTLVAVADAHEPKIHIFRDDVVTSEPVKTLSVNPAPVVAMCYNEAAGVVISADSKGIIEYWSTDPDTLGAPAAVGFKYKMETDLFELAKARTTPTSIAVSPDGKSFVVTAKDQKIRVFNFWTGKLRRVYDESLPVYQTAQNDGSLKLDHIDFGRRAAVERDMLEAKHVPPSNAVFDETGNFLLYPTLAGIKLVNLVTNRTVRILGKHESSERFLGIALFQGVPSVKSQMVLQTGQAQPKSMDEDGNRKPDPTVFAIAYKRPRFFLFSRREPVETAETSRDVFNEPPTKEEQEVVPVSDARAALGRQAVIHTTMGDIHIKLFADEVPKTIENFCGHSRSGYYNGNLFHRIIKAFMVQTGDPLGTGAGGESIWGGSFEDEFHRDLRHDRPFTVSMANAGKNTNGSQFFITTVPTPWLDNKHTVFGRVTKGMDVVRRIEDVQTDSSDRPLTDIRIVNIEIQ